MALVCKTNPRLEASTLWVVVVSILFVFFTHQGDKREGNIEEMTFYYTYTLIFIDKIAIVFKEL